MIIDENNIVYDIYGFIRWLQCEFKLLKLNN